MDLERECLAFESEEDKKSNINFRKLDLDNNAAEEEVVNNGCHVAEQNRVFSESNGKEIEYVEGDVKFESIDSTIKGKGLRKWRRIKREALKLSDDIVDGSKMLNSDQSSESLTAASASKMVNLSVNSLGDSVQFGKNGKNKMQSSKKPRGERDKLEMENSHSCLESDSRSSDFFYTQGTNFVTGNGTKEGRVINYDGENSDEPKDSDYKESESCSRENSVGFGDFSVKGLAAEFACEAKNEKSESHELTTNFDPLAESIFTLQTAQEALEKEVQKFKELGKEDDVSVDPLGVGSRPLGFYSVDLNDNGPSTSGQWQSGDGDEGTEFEKLFMQKIEAEVEFLVISKAVRNKRTAAQIILLEEQKSLAKSRAEMNKLGHALKTAALYRCEDVSLQSCSENIIIADEIVNLPKKVFKHALCFFLQLSLLILVGLFISQHTPHHTVVVPT